MCIFKRRPRRRGSWEMSTINAAAAAAQQLLVRDSSSHDVSQSGPKLQQRNSLDVSHCGPQLQQRNSQLSYAEDSLPMWSTQDAQVGCCATDPYDSYSLAHPTSRAASHCTHIPQTQTQEGQQPYGSALPSGLECVHATCAAAPPPPLQHRLSNLRPASVLPGGWDCMRATVGQ